MTFIETLSLILSGIAAVGSLSGVILLVINWWRSIHRAKISTVGRDPTLNVRPYGKGETIGKGNYGLTILLEVVSKSSATLADCTVQFETDLERGHFIDWGTYRQHFGSGEKDPLGAGAFISFTLLPRCSKVLRAGIKASSSSASISFVFTFGGKTTEMKIDRISSLDFFPRLPPF